MTFPHAIEYHACERLGGGKLQFLQSYRAGRVATHCLALGHRGAANGPLPALISLSGASASHRDSNIYIFQAS
jgi:hypothetical protein